MAVYRNSSMKKKKSTKFLNFLIVFHEYCCVIQLILMKYEVTFNMKTTKYSNSWTFLLNLFDWAKKRDYVMLCAMDSIHFLPSHCVVLALLLICLKLDIWDAMKNFNSLYRNKRWRFDSLFSRSDCITWIFIVIHWFSAMHFSIT